MTTFERLILRLLGYMAGCLSVIAIHYINEDAYRVGLSGKYAELIDAINMELKES